MSFGGSSRCGFALCVLFTAQVRSAGAEQPSAERAGGTGAAAATTAPTENAEATPQALHDAGSVRVVLHGAASPLLLEAAIRIEAELRAARFEVSSDGALGEVGSELRLSMEGTSVRIEARAARGGGEIVQRVSPSGPSGSAEVIAVRAVESLRAALLLALRDGSLDERSVGADVRDFVGLEGPLPEPSLETRPPSTPEREPALRTDRAASAAPPPWMVTLGPVATSWGQRTPLNAGAELTVRFRARWWSIGVLADGTFAGGELEAPEGTAHLQSLSLLARPALELPLGRSSGASLGADVGLHQLWILPALPSGAPLDQVAHAAFLAQFDAELHAFFGQFGLYARGRVGTLLDAPTVVEGNVTLGRPVWSAGVGLAARFGAGSERQ